MVDAMTHGCSVGSVGRLPPGVHTDHANVEYGIVLRTWSSHLICWWPCRPRKHWNAEVLKPVDGTLWRRKNSPRERGTILPPMAESPLKVAPRAFTPTQNLRYCADMI